MTALRILGIDPGTRFVGYGVLEQRGFDLTRLDSGCIAGGTGPVAERLLKIYRGLREVIVRNSPGAAAIETVFTSTNPKTAIAIGEGRGVAVLSAAESGLTVSGYEPALVKRAVTGSGRAGKDQVRSMVRVLLKLEEMPETDHEADALAIAITHALHSRLAAPATRSRNCGKLEGLRKHSLPEAILRQLPPGFTARGASPKKRAR